VVSGFSRTVALPGVSRTIAVVASSRRGRIYPRTQFQPAPSPSGKAEVCKTSIPGSNPGGASNSKFRSANKLAIWPGPDDGPVRTQSDVSFGGEVHKTSTLAMIGSLRLGALARTGHDRVRHARLVAE
jgi:hypothetical protein